MIITTKDGSSMHVPELTRIFYPGTIFSVRLLYAVRLVYAAAVAERG